MSALHNIRMVDIEALADGHKGSQRAQLDRLLTSLTGQLPRLSDLISQRYLLHAGVPRQLSQFRAEFQP